MSPAWSLVVVAVVIGHFGVNLAIYNRINALGLPRKLTKGIVKAFFLFTLLLPAAVLVFFPDLVWDLLQGRPREIPIPAPLWFYGSICLGAWIVFGVPWLMWRPIFGLEWVDAARRVEVVDVQESVQRPLALTRRCRWKSRLPLNQIFELAIERVELPVQGLPPSLDGYRIAHLSDVHLTGQVHLEFTRYGARRAMQWQPDLVALTGDIIDKQECIAWLPEIFAEMEASDGCYFVLGNHDTRIAEPERTREAMQSIGWIDLGGRYVERQLREVSTFIAGNEYPWFERPTLPPPVDGQFRFLLSHSPDQFGWAQRHGFHLMLAGHTHGGQGRLPLAGPLLGPSLHGSRYASGDFFRRPTTMHVSRGFSGTHLMRIRCRPELSLITLRRPSDVVART